MMERVFGKYLSNDLAELSGLEIEGTIPLDDQLLNEFLQEELIAFRAAAAPEQEGNKYSSVFKWINLKPQSEEGKVILKVDMKID